MNLEGFSSAHLADRMESRSQKLFFTLQIQGLDLKKKRKKEKEITPWKSHVYFPTIFSRKASPNFWCFQM